MFYASQAALSHAALSQAAASSDDDSFDDEVPATLEAFRAQREEAQRMLESLPSKLARMGRPNAARNVSTPWRSCCPSPTV
jgi:hypothetical protein